MLVRYGRSEDGSLIRHAEVYSLSEHEILQSQIDRDAVHIIRTLQDLGYEAYIVGGAIRDILLGKVPKDFDIATNASPNQLRKIFRNSRIIGRRFRLVHLFFRNRKIIEVSTFRNGKNDFGSIIEDVQRRDFTLNALYYDPIQEQLLDYCQGYSDIQHNRFRPIIALNKIFIEDPVRIIRAIKYMVISNSNAEKSLLRRIKRDRELLSGISHSRITEEIYKILESGRSKDIFKELSNQKILSIILPHFTQFVQINGLEYKLFEELEKLDERAKISRSQALRSLLRVYMEHLPDTSQYLNRSELQAEIKSILKPMCPPNKDITIASAL